MTGTDAGVRPTLATQWRTQESTAPAGVLIAPMQPCVLNYAPQPPRSTHWAWYACIPIASLALALTLIPHLNTRPTPSRRSTARTDIAMLSVALDNFRHDCGRYPTADEGLDALTEEPLGCPGWRGPYTNSSTNLRRDPWERSYIYLPPSTDGGTDYQVLSAGPDGAHGTADDIAP